MGEYRGLRIDQAKRLKGLEQENNRLKKVAWDMSIDSSILKEAVDEIKDVHRVSERWACRALEQARASQRHQAVRANHERPFREQIVALACKQ